MNAPARFTSAFSTSAHDRVLAAVRAAFRRTGRSPGFRDIQRDAGVHQGRIGRYLDQLQEEGFLTRQRGVDRSIVMVSRLANASDLELVAEIVARNLDLPIRIALVEQVRTDWQADLLADIADIVSEGDDDGATHDEAEEHER